MKQDQFGIGVVGCGGFGLFALQLFTQHPQVKLVGLANTHREAAYAAAKRFHIPDPVELDELLSWDSVDIVYIATPPFLHHPQAMSALRANKHVICEKPLALDLEQADEMMGLARDRNLLLVANLMQRYNPLYDTVKQLVDSHVLGDLLHGYFENYASDENLPHDHWFWDRSKSGGIFVEHGVHFFDMFNGWLGEGKVESAQAATRPGAPEIEDQVQCTVRYGDSVLVNFYHGFTQPGRLDRQELRLLFERGDVTLHEWVPTSARIVAVADEEQTRTLMDLFPNARLDITTGYSPKDRAARARGKPLDIYQMIEIHAGEARKKMHVYGDLLRELIDDQVKWICDRSRVRRISGENGRSSLEMACAADALARR
ncbi:MAG: Gfo/Idh/MocA family oxidoreductase [Candidatus Hydrogenedentes bacterium]|nr:Gfo/Idh/MocA family oxidoreductase [Candidatus Hydrogenedentota bacterium]